MSERVTFEEAAQWPDATDPISCERKSKVLMTDPVHGNYYWLWIPSKDHPGQCDFDLSLRQVK